MKPKTPPMVHSPGTANKNKKSLDLNASEIDTFANKSQSEFDPNALETQKNSVLENGSQVQLNIIKEPETPQLENSEKKPTPMILGAPEINIINDDFITAKESDSGRDLSGQQQANGFNSTLKTNAEFMTAVDINSNMMVDDLMAEKDMEPISEEGTVQTRSETLNVSNYKDSIGVQDEEPDLAHRKTMGGELLVDDDFVKASMKKGKNKKRGMKK
jgi:hypothetical protein